MNRLVLALAIALSPALAFSHEGHHAPGPASPQHGGTLRQLKSLHVELATNQEGLKLYVYDHDLKPLPSKDVKVEATVTFPKNPKSEPVVFTAAEDSFSAKVDAKGSHRYTLEATLTYQAKTEKAKWNIEPK